MSNSPDIQKVIKPVENYATNVESISNINDFLQQLRINNIADISDPGLVIKKNGDKYIFEKNGKDAFCVIGKTQLDNFLTSFYNIEKQRLNIQKNVVVNLTDLQIDVLFGNDNVFNQEVIKQNEQLRNAKSLEKTQERVDELINFYDSMLDDARREAFWGNLGNSKFERQKWRLQRDEAKKRIKELNTMKTNIEQMDLEEGIYQDPFVTQKTLMGYSDRLDKLSNESPDFLAYRNNLTFNEAATTPYYEIKIKTREDANRLLKIFDKQKNYLNKLNNTELSSTEKEQIVKDLERFEKYLNDVSIGIITNPEINKFIPTHKDSLKYLESLNIQDGSVSEGAVNTGNQTADGKIVENKDNKDKQEQVSANPDTTIDSRKEALEKKGINGLVKYGLDQTRMTPEQKNFWGGAANVAMIGGMCFLGWKFISSTFKLFTEKGRKDLKEGGWGWLVGPIAAIGLSQGFTGENPRSILNGGKLTEMFTGLFAGNKDKQGNTTQQNQQAIEQQQYVEGLNGAMSLFNGKTYQEIQNSLDNQDGVMKLKPDVYDTWVAQAENGDEKQKLAGQFLKDIGRDDPNNMIDLALTGMGISWDKLTNNPTDTFDDKASEVILRLGELHGYLESSNKNINPEMLPLVKKYLQENNPTLDQLKARYDVFETPVNLDDDIKNALKAKIEALNLTDPKQKKLFTEAFYRFYQNFPAENDTKRYIDIIRNGNDVLLRTYHYETKIDLDNKTIPGLTNSSGFPMQFESYQELLNVANLTNRIKYLTKDLEAKGINPFSINTFGNIEFNNTKRSNLTDIDKRILTDEGLKKISNRLGTTEKESYVKYLNNLGTWKPEVSSQSWISSIPPLLGITAPANEVVTPDAEVKDYPDALTTSYATIEALSTTPENKKLIKKALNMFYEQYPRKNLKVELTGSRPLVNFETDSKTIYINLEKQKLQGLNVDGFSSYFELFKAAGLTNRLRDIYLNKQANSLEPFHILLTDIKFDDASILSMETDNRAVSGGFFGSLKKISPKLADNKDLYVGYLNNLWLLEDKANGFFTIESLVGLPSGDAIPFDTKQKIIEGFKEFYKYLPEVNKAVKLKTSNSGGIYMETYQGETKINLLSRKIDGLDVTFDSYDELFKAANLVNRIKQITRGKQAGENPFNKSLFGRDIEFNQDHKFSDTEEVSAGLWGSLEKISPKLEENKDDFIKYLDAKRAEKLAGKPY